MTEFCDKRAQGTTQLPDNSQPAFDDTLQPSSTNEDSWIISEDYNGCAPFDCICRPCSGLAPAPPDCDERLLSVYRDKLQPLFPFVIIPSAVSALTLGSERPLLMSAIRMVASFQSPRSMQAQMALLIAEIATRMLIRAEKSLELLQCILVVSGWYNHHCLIHTQLNNLLALAASLVGEFRLNKPVSIHETTRLTSLQSQPQDCRSNEERRVITGVWFLTSIMSMTYDKIDPLACTIYTLRCAEDLESEGEYETDSMLAFLVRIQELNERILLYNTSRYPTDKSNSQHCKDLSAFYALGDELELICEKLPRAWLQNMITKVYINSALLRLYEPCAEPSKLGSSSNLAMSASNIESHIHVTARLSSIALTNWFNNWMSIPLSSYPFLTSALAGQFVYAFTMLGRWSNLYTKPDIKDIAPSLIIKADSPGHSRLFSKLDMAKTLSALSDRFLQAQAKVSAETKDSNFSTGLFGLIALKVDTVRVKLEDKAESKIYEDNLRQTVEGLRPEQLEACYSLELDQRPADLASKKEQYSIAGADPVPQHMHRIWLWGDIQF